MKRMGTIRDNNSRLMSERMREDTSMAASVVSSEKSDAGRFRFYKGSAPKQFEEDQDSYYNGFVDKKEIQKSAAA